MVVVINTQINDAMTKNRGVYSKIIDYILGNVQKQLKTLHNPFTQGQKIKKVSDELRYYLINRKTLKFKKPYKNCFDSKYAPGKISILTEEERVADLRKKLGMNQPGKDGAATIPKKPDIQFKSKVEKAEISEKTEKKIQQREEEPTKPIFEVIEEVIDFEKMITEKKLT